MSTDIDIQDKFSRAKIVKQEIIDVMSSLKEMSNVLPEKSDDNFDSAFQSLTSQKCVISICGEASRGKSYFINALIGKEILPVSEHSTTKEAFRVTYSEKESYTLFFEDGSSEPLNDASEVAHYGNELEKNIGDDRIRGRVLKYIDVKIPGKYLIPGVTFYDTPGLGSLHSSHEDVTLSCLSESDAVLFFCSSDRPFTKDELKFLTMVYKRTDNVLFILSRSDLPNKEKLDIIASRNKEILSESAVNELIQKRYGRTIDFKFYPLSSKLLLESAKRPFDEVSKYNYEFSHFEDIKLVIEALVFRTVDYSSSWIAYNTVCSYHSNVVSVIQNENKQLSTDSFEERKKFEEDVIKRKEEFEREFGENCERQKKLREKFDNAFKDILHQANLFFGQDGYLFNDITSQLDSFPEDLSGAKKFAEWIVSQINLSAKDEWFDLVKYAHDAVHEICINFQLEMEDDSFQDKRSNDSLLLPMNINDGPAIHSISAALQREKDIARAKMVNHIIEAVQTSASSAAMYFKETSGGLSIAIAGLFNIVVGFFKVPAEKTSAPEVNFANIEARFRNEVITNIRNISRFFVGINGEQGEIGKLLDSYKNDAIRLIKKEVQSRKDRFDDESERLRDNLNLSAKESADKINDNNNLLKDLDEIQNRLEDCRIELDNLKSTYDSI